MAEGLKFTFFDKKSQNTVHCCFWEIGVIAVCYLNLIFPEFG